jgi:formylglycine-generating enzyme required for sulfatase activity
MAISVLGLVSWAWWTALAQDKQGAGTSLPEKMTIDLGAGVKMDFALIRPGSFMMGSEKGDDDEKPVHEVTITKPFYMGVYEVTQAQWKAVMGDNPSNFKGDDLPVESVSWEECQGFLEKLKGKVGEGMTCRLPTEAEWEYACRAGSKTEYCFGDDEGPLGEYAWYRANSEQKTHAVGQKKPNAWGLYDMHGNVWEWCADGYKRYRRDAATDPKGPSEAAARVLRGGSWCDDAQYTRCAPRSGPGPEIRRRDYGFRVVVSAQE